MKWFRKIDMKAGLEADFSYDCTSYQNDIFSMPFSEYYPISDVELSVIPIEFYDDKKTNVIDYDIKFSEKLNNEDKEIRKRSINNIDRFEELPYCNNCTYHTIYFKSINRNNDSEFEI